MPSTTIARGNELLDTMFALTVTPSATITTATGTQQTVVVAGILAGDMVSWNLTTTGTNYNALLTIANVYAIAGSIVITWTTEGATISSAGAQTMIFSVSRPENGLAALPTNVL